jgi:AcrR family transcriptional regulator
MTTEKERRVLEAANEMFLGDIAKAAGMSRPALYLVYHCKEEIFKAGVIMFMEDALREIEAGLSERDTVRDKLDFAFEIWLIRPFEVINQLPDAKDLLDNAHGAAGDEMLQEKARFEQLLTRILEPLAPQAPQAGMTAAQVAHLMAVSVISFKENAKDVKELRSLIAGLITMTMATLGVPEELPVDRAVNA